MTSKEEKCDVYMCAEEKIVCRWRITFQLILLTIIYILCVCAFLQKHFEMGSATLVVVASANFMAYSFFCILVPSHSMVYFAQNLIMLGTNQFTKWRNDCLVNFGTTQFHTQTPINKCVIWILVNRLSLLNNQQKPNKYDTSFKCTRDESGASMV